LNGLNYIKLLYERKEIEVVRISVAKLGKVAMKVRSEEGRLEF
jgi:hypothetical protein